MCSRARVSLVTTRMFRCTSSRSRSAWSGEQPLADDDRVAAGPKIDVELPHQ